MLNKELLLPSTTSVLSDAHVVVNRMTGWASAKYTYIGAWVGRYGEIRTPLPRWCGSESNTFLAVYLQTFMDDLSKGTVWIKSNSSIMDLWGSGSVTFIPTIAGIQPLSFTFTDVRRILSISIDLVNGYDDPLYPFMVQHERYDAPFGIKFGGVLYDEMRVPSVSSNKTNP